MNSAIRTVLVFCVLLPAAAGFAAEGTPAPKQSPPDSAARRNLPTADPKEPVARVNGKVITAGDVQTVMREATPDIALEMRLRKNALVDELINRELLCREGIAKGYDRDKDIAAVPEDKRFYVLSERTLEKEAPAVVTDAEVRAYYDKHLADYSAPERVRASSIFVEKKETADAVIDELKGKKLRFSEAAVRYSTSPNRVRGGDLGYFARGEVDPEIEKAAFSMKVGSVSSDPVKTKYGYHIITVTDRRAPSVRTFEEVSGSIRDEIAGRRKSEARAALIKKLRKGAQVETYQDVIDRIE